jgi:heptosyltransferase I
MQKILIIRLSSLGDIVHTFPMVDDIKKNVANCQIDWLVDEAFADIVKLCPNVNKVITVPLRKWKRNKLQAFFNFLSWKNSIKNKDYDFIIDSQGLGKSAILTKVFNGETYGFGAYSVREKVATSFYKNKYEVDANNLAITKYRLLGKNIFNYDVEIKNVNFGLVVNKAQNNVLSLDPYVIFFHSTSKSAKRYSNNNWATLADYLIKMYNLKVVIPFGNEEEKLQALQIKKIVDSDKVEVFDKVLDYFTLADLIDKSEFIFGVDTGLIHLANAKGKKLIAIFVDTSPQKTGIFESNIAKNMGDIKSPPLISDVIDLFEKMKKI